MGGGIGRSAVGRRTVSGTDSRPPRAGVGHHAVGRTPIAGLLRLRVDVGAGAGVGAGLVAAALTPRNPAISISATATPTTVRYVAWPLAPTPGTVGNATVRRVKLRATATIPQPGLWVEQSVIARPRTIQATVPVLRAYPRVYVESVVSLGRFTVYARIPKSNPATLFVDPVHATTAIPAPSISTSTTATPRLRARFRVRRPTIVSDTVGFDTPGGIVGRTGAPGNIRVADPARQGVIGNVEGRI